MKKLFNLLALVLAMNFLAAAGGVGWLFQRGQLDKAKMLAVKEIVFPKTQPAAPATQPAKAEPPTPLLRLDTLLAKQSGRRAGEQVEVIQQTFDAQSAQLDRRWRELDNLQAQLAGEQKKLAEASAALEAARRQLADREQQATQQGADKGFEKTLEIYSSDAKLAKASFMDLPDDAVARYLGAMDPRARKKVIQEFKSPPEKARVGRVLGRMSQAGPSAPPATQPAADGAAPPKGPADAKEP